jgi:hypothetical protein
VYDENIYEGTMMKKMKLIVILLASVLFLTGCVGFPELRNSNREKLSQIQIGMSKTQVETIMGQNGFMDIKQPYRREVFESNGNAFEVLYYYTDFIQDFQPIDTGMTPVIFRNGRFIGTGKDFLFKVR